jgi:hypothetical protein
VIAAQSRHAGVLLFEELNMLSLSLALLKQLSCTFLFFGRCLQFNLIVDILFEDGELSLDLAIHNIFDSCSVKQFSFFGL